jgi:hypothetical protein
MLIYNVTIAVSASIADAWLQWLKQVHIPEVMATGCFADYLIVRLLEVDESEGPTYAVQYKALSRADYNRYIEVHAPRLRQASLDRWGDGFIAFRSLLEVIN